MIPDLTGKTVEEITALLEHPDTGPALRQALARYLAQLDDPNGVISAFSSFVE